MAARSSDDGLWRWSVRHSTELGVYIYIYCTNRSAIYNLIRGHPSKHSIHSLDRSLINRLDHPHAFNQPPIKTSSPCAGATMKFTTTTVLLSASAASAAILKRQNQGDGYAPIPVHSPPIKDQTLISPLKTLRSHLLHHRPNPNPPHYLRPLHGPLGAHARPSLGQRRLQRRRHVCPKPARPSRLPRFCGDRFRPAGRSRRFHDG
jgi:hypothetical protein